jgi:hypothetical protein
MSSGNADGACSVKHCKTVEQSCKTAADTGGDFYGHIGGSSFSARCSLASSGAAAECWEVDTKQSEDLSVPVTDTDVQEIL